jgi:hypothetical protein
MKPKKILQKQLFESGNDVGRYNGHTENLYRNIQCIWTKSTGFGNPADPLHWGRSVRNIGTNIRWILAQIHWI